jgi:flagellar M-ring protein FliF
MNYLQKILAVWQKVSLVQRVLLVAVVLTFGAGSVVLTYWAKRPDMRLLYQDLAPEEAAGITEKIAEKGIPYQLRSGGTSIYVPQENVYQLRLDMAKDGLPAGQQGGYKIFDDNKIGVSPFIQNVNLKRALQDELAKSIQMIDGVSYARVHIVTTEQTLFTSEAGKTTASVVLKLKPGYKITPVNIAAIMHLVSGSVEGLASENVTIIDSQGRLLSGSSGNAIASGTGTVQDYQERVEQSLQNKVEEMLTTVLGPGRATVKVHAMIDTNSISTVTETYEPKGVPTKEESTTVSEKPLAGTSAEGQPTAGGTAKTDEKTITEYHVGKTVKQQVVLPGEIKSLSVAAFVDLSPDANEGQATAGTTAKIMEIKEVEQIIRNALGLKDADSLKVVDTKFRRQAVVLPDEDKGRKLDFIAIARQGSLGIMAICALIVLRMFKGAKKKAQAQTGTAMLSMQENTAGFARELPTAATPAVLRRQIAGALENDPEKVRLLFAKWLEEK